jgi:hypothetical protein
MQYQIFDGEIYISIIRSGGKLLRLRDVNHPSYAITYDKTNADYINTILNGKGISSTVIPYTKTWKNNKFNIKPKTKTNDIITNNQQNRARIIKSAAINVQSQEGRIKSIFQIKIRRPKCSEGSVHTSVE